ncbi:MAG: hypothetical protein ACI94Y_001243 [Maribacter sp.]|jgi:hypothetical protein
MTKKILFIFISSLFIFSCGNTESEDTNTATTENEKTTASTNPTTSFLEEMYKREVAKKEDGKTLFNISFDMHDKGCISPDCFQSDVSFEMDKGINKFPTALTYNKKEYGECVPKEAESEVKGTLELVENNEEHSIYHDTENSTTLVLFKNPKKIGTYAYLFSRVDKDEVTSENIYTIVRDYDEEDEDAIFPVSSYELSAY